MANEVYANGMEVACKAGSGKTIAAFPDVCLSPPSPPAGPVPLPYPNTAYDSDTTKGSKTVMISGQEVMLKDSSTMKKSTGDEAATKTLGMGVVTHQITGEVSFTSWSMDVKIEGENVDRHLDLTLHNEQCMPANTPPWPFVSKVALAQGGGPCKKEVAQEKAACSGFNPREKACGPAGLTASPKDLTDTDFKMQAMAIQRGGGGKARKDMTQKEKALECVRARRCMLGPYNPSKCCPSQTPDHVVPKSSFFTVSVEHGTRLPGWGGDNGYDIDKAPCMCAEGPNNTWGSHGLRHAHHKAFPPVIGGKEVQAEQRMPFNKAVSHAAEGAATVFKASGCTQECLEYQLKRGHQDMCDSNPPPEVKYSPSGSASEQIDVAMGIEGLNPGR